MIRLQKVTNKDDITHLMPIIAYNSTIHSATSFTPFELLFGHTSRRNPLEIYNTNEYYQDYVNKHKIMRKLINSLLTN